LHALTLGKRLITHKAAMVGTSDEVWRTQKVTPVGA
jgi:hypothetical protein